MTSLSSLDSKIGLTICSPHWIARLDAVREPVGLVAGRRSAAGRCCSCARASTAQVVGCGSATTSRSSFSMPFGRLRHAGHGVAAVPHDEHRLDVVLLGHLLLAAAASRRTSASTGCRASPSIFLRRPKRRSDASSRSRPPRRGTSAARRLRPGRSRAAASRYRGRGRSRPARWCGRGRCWRRCRACRRCRWRAAAMQLARTLAVPTVCWVWPIAQISVDGLLAWRTSRRRA